MAGLIAERLTAATDVMPVLPVTRVIPASTRMSPNAILQLAAVLRDERHDRWLRDVFYRSGLSAMLINPTASMVEEVRVADLYQALFDRLSAAAAARIAGEAGRRTGRHILAHRIPKPARFLLRVLPRRLSALLLLQALQHHARTFAGSGAVTVEMNSLAIVIARNPIAMPGCVWHVAVFEELFRHLVSPQARVAHAICCAEGHAACRFEITLDGDDGRIAKRVGR